MEERGEDGGGEERRRRRGGGGGGGGGGGDEMHGRLALTPIFLLPNQGISVMQTLLECRG